MTKDKRVLALKISLLQRHLTIAELARQLKRPRSTVSQAIHHRRFPRVIEQIEEALTK